MYPKLRPEQSEKISLQDLIKEAEGVLASEEEQKEKLSPMDFVLWKKSKPGEPLWPSEFGDGRPGWHIECSVMAAEFFKEYPIDIHSGGIDLRFPHHDNEIA